jgi:hypothetical protein
VKSKQFCSVCKEWLEMEVVPTGDGDDDGVIWYRCPQCQGFLPKLSAGDPSTDANTDTAATGTPAEETATPSADDDMPFDSPAEMMAAREAADLAAGSDLPAELESVDLDAVGLDDLPLAPEAEIPATEEAETRPRRSSKAAEPAEPAEPIAEYAAQLEAALSDLPVDQTGGRPYRPWEAYEVGTCIQHLAWEDCGIVVAKEELPGGRQVIKVFFQEAGVVRLIEQAPK